MTNFDDGIDYLTPAMENAPYWFWPPALDIVPDGPGAYAVNKDVPPIEEVIEGGVFCAGVVNLIRRANRKVIPTMGDDRYDGGTWACQHFWHLFMEQFNIYSVYPRGTLIGRYFKWAGDPGASIVLDQGHVAMLWDEHNLVEQKDAWVVQSHPDVGGLNWWTRLTESNFDPASGNYYDYAVRPEYWIDHDMGGF
jgi:hypothetical protein